MKTPKRPDPRDDRSTRRYDNRRRSEAARETRRRIVRSAGECFVETGFHATSVRAIAERADTSPETIYVAFGSKIRLLQAWIDQAVTGDDEDVSLREREVVTAMFSMEDVEGMLRDFVRIGRLINERVAAPIQVLRAAALSSPELAALLAENERRRQVDFATAVANLAAATPLPNGFSVERAAELVAALCSVDLYRSLVLEASWTVQEYETQLVHLLASTLGLP